MLLPEGSHRTILLVMVHFLRGSPELQDVPRVERDGVVFSQAGPAVGSGPFVAGVELVRTHFIQAQLGFVTTKLHWCHDL